MNKCKVERDWVTKVGLRAVCVFSNYYGYRCGYVAIPPSHPLYGLSCSDRIENPSKRVQTFLDNSVVGKRGPISLVLAGLDPTAMTHVSLDVLFDVHGSLTYGQAAKDGYPVPNSNDWWFGFDCAHLGDGSFFMPGPVRTEEYVVKECERLAAQIVILFGDGKPKEEEMEDGDGQDDADLSA
jgi:hypothetical protein